MEKITVLDEFFFSQIQGIPIFDHLGQQVGNLRDIAIASGEWQTSVTGIKYIKKLQKHIPVNHFAPILA